MKKITAVVAVVLCASAVQAQVIVNPSRSAGDIVSGLDLRAQGLIVNADAGNGVLDVAALTGARHSVDPKMIHHVDPSIDPKIVRQYPSNALEETNPYTFVLPSPELMLPEFKLHDFKGAIPLPNGTLDLKPGDSLRINGPNLNLEIPLPRVRVPKP